MVILRSILIGSVLTALIGTPQEPALHNGSYPHNGGEQHQHTVGFPLKQKVYCKWCGQSFPDVRTLAINTCNRNPEGSKRHELYEGSEKPQYSCKFCGQTFRTIGDMSVTQTCGRKPNKRHEPAL
jgi:hypothetical protein